MIKSILRFLGIGSRKIKVGNIKVVSTKDTFYITGGGMDMKLGKTSDIGTLTMGDAQIDMHDGVLSIKTKTAEMSGIR